MAEDCAFCDRSKFEERLISETELFYVVATLGQITEGGYALIIPKYHLPCIADMHDTKAGPFLNLVDEVRQAIEKEYGQEVLIFEHGIVGQSVKHAHLHLLPTGNIADKIATTVRQDFVAEVDCFPTNHMDSLWEMYEKTKEPYLFWMDGSGTPYICWDPPAPMQYLRTVIAKLLGRPERANWRNMSPELDRQLWSDTVKRLKPYFKPRA
ncbi:MAG: Uncharacterized protein G01um10143_771 [Parcubacteria group bacterium Gr01-1014_3]|nr:MAG: Uncharacterized protein G01um10143_771 [Parcubacteria group bacterium Gr01-1014_3]